MKNTKSLWGDIILGIWNKGWVSRLTSDNVSVCFYPRRVATSMVIIDKVNIWYGAILILKSVGVVFSTFGVSRTF